MVGGFCIFYFLSKSISQKKETKEITIKPEEKEEIKIEQKLPPQELPKVVKEVPTLPEKTAKDKDIEKLIKNLESEDWSIVQEATDKLASLGKVAVPSLLEALKEASVGLKGQIIFLLGRIGDREGTPTLLEILRKDENAYIRTNAAEALGKIKDERAIDFISSALFDDDGRVRERSAWALGEIGDTRGVGDLLNRITYEKEENVKLAIINAFAKIKDPRATPTLITELKTQSDQLYKNELVISLGEIADPRALPDLIEYLDALKQYQPTEPIVKFQWEQAIKIAEEAIEKIQKKQ